MGFLSIIYKTIKLIIALILILLILTLSVPAYRIITALPAKRNIPPDDEFWTSEVYVKLFEKPEKWRFIESFVHEQFVYRDQMLPWLKDDQVAFGREALRLFWEMRNDQKGYKPGVEISPPPGSPPIIGGVGGTDRIQADIVDVTSSRIIMTTSSVFSPDHKYRGGMEVFEIDWLPGVGATLRLKYAWHNAVRPKSKKRQWVALYLQLMGRYVVVQKTMMGLVELQQEQVVVEGS